MFFISFLPGKSHKMKLPGNIQLLFHKKLKKNPLTKTLHSHYLIAKLAISKEKHIAYFSIHDI